VLVGPVGLLDYTLKTRAHIVPRSFGETIKVCQQTNEHCRKPNGKQYRAACMLENFGICAVKNCVFHCLVFLLLVLKLYLKLWAVCEVKNKPYKK
jgi:hypothetical protein